MEGEVELGHSLGGLAVQGAQDHPVWVHEIVYRRALPQELGIRDHGEGHVGILVFFHNIGHPVAGANGHGALVNDDQGVVHSPGHVFRGVLHVLQVGLPVHTGGRADGNEDQLGLTDSLLVGGGEIQAAGLVVPPDDLLQAGLVDGHDTLFQIFRLLLAPVQTDHVVPQVSQACPGDQSHVTNADHADRLHCPTS